MKTYMFSGTDIKSLYIDKDLDGKLFILHDRNIQSLVVGDHVTEIRTAEYQNMPITSLVLGTSITKIGGSSFKGCAALEEPLPVSLHLICSQTVVSKTYRYQTK